MSFYLLIFCLQHSPPLFLCLKSPPPPHPTACQLRIHESSCHSLIAEARVLLQYSVHTGLCKTELVSIWNETWFLSNKVARHIRWKREIEPFRKKRCVGVASSRQLLREPKQILFWTLSAVITLMPLQILPRGGCTFYGCWIISCPDRIPTCLWSSLSPHVALKAAWGPIYLFSTVSSVDLIGYPLLPTMNHCRASSLPSSTYFYWMQGSPESKGSTLKLCPSAPVIYPSSSYFTAVSVSLLFQQRIMGQLLCIMSLQREARSSNYSPHSANWLLIW